MNGTQNPDAVNASLRAAELLLEKGRAVQNALQAELTNDPERQISAFLEAASTSEALADAMAAFGPSAPLDFTSIADEAVGYLSMAANLLFRQGRKAEADSADLRATNIAERLSSRRRDLTLRLDQAKRCLERGRFAIALAALAKVRDEASTAGFADVMYEASMGRAETLESLGDAARALEELDTIQSPAALGPTEDKITDPLGSLIKSFGAHLAALEVQLRARMLRFACLRDLAETDPAKLNEAATELAAAASITSGPLLHLGAAIRFFEAQLALIAGKADQAVTILDPLADEYRADPRLTPKIGMLLEKKGRALLALGRVPEARETAAQATAALAATGQDGNIWRAHQLQAEIAQREGMVNERRLALAAGIDAVERMRLAPLGWRLDNLYLKPRSSLYRDAIVLAAEDGDGVTALTLVEAIKSRAITAIIGASRAMSPGADPALVRQYDALDSAISSLQAEVLTHKAVSGAAARLDALRRERAELAERLRYSDPRWQTLTTPVPSDPIAIVSAMKALGAIALDLYLDGTRLISVVVEGDTVKVVHHTLDLETVQELERLVAGISPLPLNDGTARLPNPIVKDPATLGIVLDNLLPAETAARAAAANRLLIAAHGPLHLLPWPVVPISVGGPRLIVRTEVGLLPNLSCLPALAARPASKARCAVLGAPTRAFGPLGYRTLPTAALHTATEVAALYSARDSLIASAKTGADATTTAFRDLCANPEAANAILHTTCHGEPPRSEPGDAALLLADANLEAAAIATDGIPFGEVVLTACSTGFRPTTEAQGIPLSGDDALGLPGAFLEAGASTMLVSIPLAQADAAHHIAIAYHSARLEGEAPLGAFRRAQLALLSDPSMRPYNACGFVLYGCR